jgi:hypothetical protein
LSGLQISDNMGFKHENYLWGIEAVWSINCKTWLVKRWIWLNTLWQSWGVFEPNSPLTSQGKVVVQFILPTASIPHR